MVPANVVSNLELFSSLPYEEQRRVMLGSRLADSLTKTEALLKFVPRPKMGYAYACNRVTLRSIAMIAPQCIPIQGGEPMRLFGLNIILDPSLEYGEVRLVKAEDIQGV